VSNPGSSPHGSSSLPANPDSEHPSHGAAIGQVPTAVSAPLTSDNAGSSKVSSASLERLAAQAREFADRSCATNTRRAYRSDWVRFRTWCSTRALASQPAAPATLALYLTEHAATRRASALQRWMASIS
jgi:hypothetical protein